MVQALSKRSNSIYCSKKKAKLADVSWDYISLPASFDPILREKSNQFTDGLLVLFERFAGKKSRYAVNSFIADFKDIPIDSADELANHLYDYIAKELGLG